MSRISRLGACAEELAIAATTIAAFCKHHSNSGLPGDSIPPDAPQKVLQAKQSVITNSQKLEVLLAEPADFIQRLARENQLLACLQWLGEFQVLACIPIVDSVHYSDVADLACVPVDQLRRIARMTITAGFLQEPKPGYVAHSGLSAPFVKQPVLLDAAMFLSETLAPSALHMSLATKRHGRTHQTDQCAFNTAFNTKASFADSLGRRPRLQRQWPSFSRYAIADDEAGVEDVMTRLDWLSLGEATVVDVCAKTASLATALTSKYPSLRFVVQSEEQCQNHTWSRSLSATKLHNGLSTPPESDTGPAARAAKASERLELQQRALGSPQNVTNAAVYILRLGTASPFTSWHKLRAQATAELSAHADILRKEHGSRLILVTRTLPKPGEVETTVEAMARFRDLTLMQLANVRELETSEVVELLNSVHIEGGCLVLTNELRTRNSGMIAFEATYQPQLLG
ncbi:toxin biosynthesis regulatory protein-like protein [Dothistroma septosporum NZE10]|uniref:Dothistromin biosynthesis regulatory protein aflJ n=1 Tax=Dothistroma septosporum (strain NZE10 / CBS 128990) TaxID=675120 RepID=AFLJ_DOTSN|nr:RecName: Full=Dothistromin biosynthesis regulatory protein aflJ [Dothistroma septosporum NZE10]EME38896.1 toxin biosynthesis regulatory protein-like protein [Dothistroma septosporum NZE10]